MTRDELIEMAKKRGLSTEEAAKKADAYLESKGEKKATDTPAKTDAKKSPEAPKPKASTTAKTAASPRTHLDGSPHGGPMGPVGSIRGFGSVAEQESLMDREEVLAREEAARRIERERPVIRSATVAPREAPLAVRAVEAVGRPVLASVADMARSASGKPKALAGSDGYSPDPIPHTVDIDAYRRAWEKPPTDMSASESMIDVSQPLPAPTPEVTRATAMDYDEADGPSVDEMAMTLVEDRPDLSEQIAHFDDDAVRAMYARRRK